jgi:hypothetical protein
VGRILVPTAFIAFGLGDFMPATGLDINIQFGLLILIVGGRVELHFRGSEDWLLGWRWLLGWCCLLGWRCRLGWGWLLGWCCLLGWWCRLGWRWLLGERG